MGMIMNKLIISLMLCVSSFTFAEDQVLQATGALADGTELGLIAQYAIVENYQDARERLQTEYPQVSELLGTIYTLVQWEEGGAIIAYQTNLLDIDALRVEHSRCLVNTTIPEIETLLDAVHNHATMKGKANRLIRKDARRIINNKATPAKIAALRCLINGN